MDAFINAITEVSKQIAIVITHNDDKEKYCAAVHEIIKHDFEKIEAKVEEIEKEIK